MPQTSQTPPYDSQERLPRRPKGRNAVSGPTRDRQCSWPWRRRWRCSYQAASTRPTPSRQLRILLSNAEQTSDV